MSQNTSSPKLDRGCKPHGVSNIISGNKGKFLGVFSKRIR